MLIDLAKAFDAVDHKILLRKMEIYGIDETTLEWFENFSTNRKQYIQISNFKNRFKKCCMRSSPGINIRSSFILDIFKRPTICFKFIRPHYDTNLFYAEENIKTLFDTVKIELQKINLWFISNKLSFNVTKTEYSFFHKPSKKDNIPLILPKLSICNDEIKRSESIKFLGVFLDGNLT